MRSVVTETLWILNESAVYLLVGFALAGVLHWWVGRSPRFSNALSARGSKSVFLAALLGLPLPLCSCSVLPAGLALRKKGASKGATVSFLISVPETDIVSVFITYGLLGPVMAVFRPFAALVTAIVTGLATDLTERWTERRATPHADTDDATPGEECDDYDTQKGALWNILHYGFVKFFDDIIPSLALGIVLGGAITALLPSLGLERFADQSFVSMLVMLVVGIPMYVCATSSTPIAAGLLAGGLSPGAVLVFLLAGPATNTASVLVLLKHLGRPVLAVYLVSIALISVLMGLWLDAFMAPPTGGVSAMAPLAGESSWVPLKIGGSILLLVLTYLSLRRTRLLGALVERAGRRFGLPLSARSAQIAAALCALLVYTGSGLFTVNPGERGVVTRFGRITRADLGPGLHYRWPYPFARADVESIARVRRVELGFRPGADPSGPREAAAYEREMRGESWMLTGNEDIVDIEWVVQYRIAGSKSGLLAYLYGVERPDDLVRDAAEAAIRAAVGCRSIDTLLTTERQAVERTVMRDLLQPALDRCAAGIEIIDVSLMDVHAPPDVHRAFRDVASAAEEKMEIINTAYEYQERELHRAGGEAARRVATAEGRALKIIEDSAGKSNAFLDRLSAYRVQRVITRLRIYFEAVDAVLPEVRKYIHATGDSGEGLELWLINDDQAKAGLPFTPQRGETLQP